MPDFTSHLQHEAGDRDVSLNEMLGINVDSQEAAAELFDKKMEMSLGGEKSELNVSKR